MEINKLYDSLLIKKISYSIIFVGVLLLQTQMYAQRVRTVAGTGIAGFSDGAGAAASFSTPQGVAVDNAGNVYVADSGNHKIRKINSAGVVTTFAGASSLGDSDGIGIGASFNYPIGIAIDGLGNLYVTDNNKIRKITPFGEVTTLAGTNVAGFSDGTGTAASFNLPQGIAVDNSGNIYVADTNNQKIRKITPSGEVTTLAGSGSIGFDNGNGSEASFNKPEGVAVDGSGNVFVTDTHNHVIRKINSSGEVTTFSGSGIYGIDNGIGSSASFWFPSAIAVDDFGNLYTYDGSYKIRKII